MHSSSPTNTRAFCVPKLDPDTVSTTSLYSVGQKAVTGHRSTQCGNARLDRGWTVAPGVANSGKTPLRSYEDVEALGSGGIHVTQRLMDALIAHPAAALGTGKLLRPDGATLDSAGISLPHHRRPRDRGSEEQDRGQYERGEYVFGASGAAMMLRTEALADLAIEGEIFDEDFFLYHEDTDLCWRSHLLGWRVYYEPRARAVHARGWQREGRFLVPAHVRRHSFKNHYLQIIKNESLAGFLLRLPLLLAWEALRLGHALLRDRAILGGYADAARLAGRALHKRRLLQARRARGRTT